MKKSVIGFIFGLVLALSVTAGAEVYQFILSPHSLFVDGEQIEQPMFLKDGTNYLPLRAVGEALGADVSYKDGRIDIIENSLETVAVNCKDSCVMIYTYNGKEKRQGSGWIYNGYIVTAKHVVDGADKIEIFFDDDKAWGADIVPIETNLDVAVLKTYTEKPSVKLGDSDKLKEGERLVSITSPGDAKNTLEECTYSGREAVETEHDIIISDTVITGGSSGGAVFNYDSEIIGMAFYEMTEAKGITGAIPINDIKPVLENLK